MSGNEVPKWHPGGVFRKEGPEIGSRNDIREGCFGKRDQKWGPEMASANTLNEHRRSYSKERGSLLRSLVFFLLVSKSLVGVRKSFGRFWGKELFGGKNC